MVRTYRILPSPYNPRPNGRILNTIDSPPTAGLFVKVPTRPTNHSKFTGKCSRARCLDCHLHPAHKSKDKTKGSNKIKSLDILGRQRVSWRVVDGHPAGSLSGVSATGLLDGLVDYDCDDDEGLICRGLVPAAGDEEDSCESLAGQDRCEHNGSELEFYKVGFELDHIEEGDWCLVRD
ncbi:hypothetical protein MLD38_000130 [Melastoma candidum]|nr:hypothetical protein MLD38_000130 [Melastoma candidum]